MIKILNKRKINNQNLILIVLAFFSVAVGLWGNYRQLYLASNNLSATSISRVISIAAVVAALSLLFYTKKFSINKLKIGMLITLFIKIFISIILLLIDQGNNLFLIKFLSFFDIACENIILSSIYPYIMCYEKSEELYGKKSVFENLGKTVGILIGSLIFGKIIFSLNIGFKECLLITILFNLLALITLALISDRQKIKLEDKSNNTLKYLYKNKILLIYLLYNNLTNISYSLVVGLKMLMLTTYNNFNTSIATYIILLLAIIDIIFGALTIKRLKSKNDYINISIKFLVRILLYILVFFTNNLSILLLAMAYTLITNISYGNIISGYITNTIKEKYILDFTVINYIVNLIGEAIGIFIAGLLFDIGFKYIYIISALIVCIQLVLSYYIIYNKRKKQKSLL